ncbi:L-seryl-tRNA(Sec) selenium transferase [Paenibacillus thalictri]|uniref:L-seryl-tRNA(Sec) selenium transferase n=2 Tax=Paenibacillus thalictri TaxID=2527873 RepID=A0A4Q9DMD3_9BACL|nr:L-seryl-tRNA(Sec) selenium transferase [Paenibacillus thalictri]
MLRSLPAVHKLVGCPQIQSFVSDANIPHEVTVGLAQELIAEWRERIVQGTLNLTDEKMTLELLTEQFWQKAAAMFSPRLRRVINGTGVVLHTNLGRAVLGESMAKQIVEAACYYSNLEYNISEGERGSRHSHVDELICRLTGAEAAMVVNNNAAAVFLVLREMAKGRRVIVSRGHLVEIGGSFRVSEIMAESGANLVEVGTTNKTHLYDYERAIDSETALLMKVHSSNFRITGFTSSVSLEELAALGEKYQIPVYEDLGSGALFDLRAFGVGEEPVVREVIESGADLVSFSGDKLLGGPQAGIIAGKKKWIDRLKKNQLARVLRVDKMTLAGLEATLRLYLLPEQAAQEIPTLRDILVPLHEIKEKARRFVTLLSDTAGIQAEIVDDESAVGGGTLPGVALPTKAADLTVQGLSAHQLEEKLRLSEPAVIVRVQHHRVRIDFRTVHHEEIEIVAEALRKITAAQPSDVEENT